MTFFRSCHASYKGNSFRLGLKRLVFAPLNEGEPVKLASFHIRLGPFYFNSRQKKFMFSLSFILRSSNVRTDALVKGARDEGPIFLYGTFDVKKTTS